MPASIPPFTLADFDMTPAKRAEMTQGLTERQAFLANRWMDVLTVVSEARWDDFEDLFDTEKMTYANPNRPDMGNFAQWSSSPMALRATFPPCLYRTIKVWARGDDEICAFNHHYGKHTGAPYMGVQPTGNELNSLWFSWIKFEGDKIVHIYSISDVLSMLIDLEVISAPQPVDPYK